MGDAKLDLLKAIMDAYPFEGGGNCIKAAVFHSHMLNTFKPAFDQLVVEQLIAHATTEGDDEPSVIDVVVMSDPNAWPLKKTKLDVVNPAPATEEE